MFNDYLATPDDIQTISEALKFVLHSKMRFVFANLSKIKKTFIISYDSQFIYIWRLGSEELEYKIPHKIKIKDEWQSGWQAGIGIAQIENLLPVQIKNKRRFEIPIINGGLFAPFIALQKVKRIQNNPYITRESYLATIIHEFGHIYWSQFKLWWPSDKKYNIGLLRLAKQLYQENTRKKINFPVKLPILSSLGEVFAFCTEYYASEIFWPNHKLNLDKFSIELITKLLEIEKGRDLDKEDSVIEPTKTPHDFSMVYGRILLSYYSHAWPQLLISPFILKNT